jgi:hypothetical protein
MISPKGNFVGVSFVHSSRDILARCMKERGCTHADAIKLLAGLPTTLAEWKKPQNASNQRELATDTAGATK